MILIERITLDGAGRAASRGVGGCAARGALRRKMQAADDPQHPRNIDHAKYETKENRKAQSELNRGGAAFTANKSRVAFQTIAAFLARCSSESGSMQGLNR